MKGGSLKGDVNGMIYHAHSMLSEARIIKRIDEVIELQKLYEKLKLLSDKSEYFEYNDIKPLYGIIQTFYEPILDDVIIFSAFEMYAKAILLNK